MIKKWQDYLDSLDYETVVNRKMVFFELLTALLGGFVLGFLFAPKRSYRIGNNNGNTTCCRKKDKDKCQCKGKDKDKDKDETVTE